MTNATRYENRLREKVQDLDSAIVTVQAHIAVRDPENAAWLTEVRERLQQISPGFGEVPASAFGI